MAPLLKLTASPANTAAAPGDLRVTVTEAATQCGGIRGHVPHLADNRFAPSGERRLELLRVQEDGLERLTEPVHERRHLQTTDRFVGAYWDAVQPSVISRFFSHSTLPQKALAESTSPNPAHGAAKADPDPPRPSASTSSHRDTPKTCRLRGSLLARVECCAGFLRSMCVPLLVITRRRAVRARRSGRRYGPCASGLFRAMHVTYQLRINFALLRSPSEMRCWRAVTSMELVIAPPP